MADERDTERERSIAGLSVASEARSAQALVGADGARYHELEVIGEGGLGTVMRAHDRFLGREIALKRIGVRARTAPAMEVQARFLREARITARLDHPGIVPVHDAGVTDDGRMFYTMRLIRGRSLADLAAAARAPEDRLALLGSITAACHAVGYAHRHGVIHRDLKPANIMVGELGETQVVDWGLADVLAEQAPPGGFAGTYPYASPEVLRGAPPSIASDVWALGVTLHEVLTGEHRFPGDRDAIEKAVTAVPLPPARWPEDCPRELVAIGERAMAAEPADRYRDGHELARDLDAFRDGRRVRAYSYSRLELLRRFVVAWRWPLVATVTLAVGTIGALALTNHRTEAQRARAVTAEASTRQQLARAEAALADALAQRAVVALEQGALAEAELTAAAALDHAEHPDARGVLSATRAAPHPTSARHVTIPGCPHVVALGVTTALCVARDSIAVWELEPAPRSRWQRPLQVEGAVALGDARLVGWTGQGEVLVIAADTGVEQRRAELGPIAGVERSLGGERVVMHDRQDVVLVTDDGRVERFERACGTRAIAAVSTSDTTPWVLCAGGEVGTLGERGFQVVQATGFGTEVSAASALALSESGHDLAIGSTAGDVMLLDLRGCMSPGCQGTPRTRTVPGVVPAAIRHLALLGGQELIVVGERGDAVHVRADRHGELTRLPIAPGAPLTFLEGGGLLAGGARFSHWQLDDRQAPSVIRHYRGLTAAAISSDRRIAATLADDSELLMWDLATGARLSRVQVLDARSVALSADGEEVTVSHGAGRSTFATATGALRATHDGAPAIATSAVAFAPHRVSIDRWEIEIEDAEITQAVRSADGRLLAIATSKGRIELREVASRRTLAVLRGHIQRVTYLAFDRDRLWSAGLDGRLRSWALAPLDAPRDQLARDARAAWGEDRR